MTGLHLEICCAHKKPHVAAWTLGSQAPDWLSDANPISCLSRLTDYYMSWRFTATCDI